MDASSPRPTRVELRDGQLVLLPGDPGGERPVIEAGPHVILRINGTAVHVPKRIEDGDNVVIEPEVVEPEALVRVHVAPDRMSASVTIERVPGRRYVLEDAPATVRLRVQARLEGDIEPPEAGPEEIRQALERAGVCFGVLDEAVVQAARQPPGVATEVARGVAPVEPVDGRGDLLFQEREEVVVDPGAERVDLFERGAIAWVQPGTELAVLHFPREGRPGTNVLGQTIPVRQPRPIPISAGRGTQLSEDGSRIVATEAGRPARLGSVLSVVPVYEVKGDVDVSVGHVRFPADVHVRGDVLDNLEIRAGGNVRVGGLVSHAQVSAAGHVQVGRTIIGSTVKTGGQAALVQEVHPTVVAVAAGVRELLGALDELRGQASEGARVSGGRLSEPEIVKRLLERRYWDLPRMARRLASVHTKFEELVPGGSALAQRAVELLVGMGPLRPGSTQRLAQLAGDLQQAGASLAELSSKEANVVAYSVQNSRIEATGKVTIKGHGSFNSVISAARGFDARQGVIRGGQLTVLEGDVLAKELGTPTGVPTAVTVVRRGKVVAGLVHPHVTVTIAGQRHVFQDAMRAVRCYVTGDDRLAVEGLKAEGAGASQ